LYINSINAVSIFSDQDSNIVLEAKYVNITNQKRAYEVAPVYLNHEGIDEVLSIFRIHLIVEVLNSL
jgi:hypothetical protein